MASLVGLVCKSKDTKTNVNPSVGLLLKALRLKGFEIGKLISPHSVFCCADPWE